MDSDLVELFFNLYSASLLLLGAGRANWEVLPTCPTTLPAIWMRAKLSAIAFILFWASSDRGASDLTLLGSPVLDFCLALLEAIGCTILL